MTPIFSAFFNSSFRIAFIASAAAGARWPVRSAQSYNCRRRSFVNLIRFNGFVK